MVNKQTLRNIREWLMDIKVYMGRTVSYIALLNSTMILYLVLRDFKDLGFIDIKISHLFIPLVIIGAFALLIIGWFDVKVWKAMQSEKNKQFEVTPHFVKMKNQLEYLYQKEREREEK